MSLSLFARKTVVSWGLAVFTPAFVFGQAGFTPQGTEYGIAGALPGDQVRPAVAIKPAGGFVVWQDNVTDGAGTGISARRLDSSFSSPYAPFRVNAAGAGNQENPQVALLNNGGAVFVWHGGAAGRQNIFARFLSPSNTWTTAGDVLVNTYTNEFRVHPAVACLADGNVVVTWGSFGQEAGANTFQGVYAQRLSPDGQKLGPEFPVNTFTPFNQRTPTVAALANGGFVIAWVSEQERFANSVDVFARLFDAGGTAVSSEIFVNTSSNVCANPRVAAANDGTFLVVWGERDLRNNDNSWDIWSRPFSSAGAGGTVRCVNTNLYGDQFLPNIAVSASDYLVVWTSLGQDGSREGVYGRCLQGGGTFSGNEFRVNATTASQQIHPAVASDGAGHFLAVWAGFVGGPNSFDLFAQRYAATGQLLLPPGAAYVTALSSNLLSVAWPVVAGFDLAGYEVYVDGAASLTAVVTNNMWRMTNLAPATVHSFQYAYVLVDGRRSPLSPTASGTTFGLLTYSGIPVEWMAYYFGDDWPLASADSDGDGVSNRNEFLAGTDPTDPNSVLRVRLQRTQQGLFLNWNTEPGLVYQVQDTADMRSWRNLGLPRFSAGAVDSMYVGGGRAGYFRIIRLR